jgi:hypothetical protein
MEGILQHITVQCVRANDDCGVEIGGIGVAAIAVNGESDPKRIAPKVFGCEISTNDVKCLSHGSPEQQKQADACSHEWKPLKVNTFDPLFWEKYSL